jgi:hypothetical protein
MYNRLNCINTAVVLASCLWVSNAGAISVPYDHDTHANEGMAKFRSTPQMPFDSFPGPMGATHSDRLLNHLNREYHHPWNVSAGFGHDQGAHWDSNRNDLNIPYPPHSTGHCPPITSAPSAVPVPAALWLFLSGLIGLGLSGKSRRR